MIPCVVLRSTGLNVRLTKNKTSIDDLILKIERFFISFNLDEFIDYQTMTELVNRKPEFKRRFYLYNMDALDLQNSYGRPKSPWKKIPAARRQVVKKTR